MRTKPICTNHNFKAKPKRKLIKPRLLNPDDYEEIKRLMKRPIPDEFPVTDEFLCELCNLEPHGPHSCPWMKQLPAGEVPGPGFDAVCIGCGKIGEICPGYDAYAVRKFCFLCARPCHWFWEDRCPDKTHHNYTRWITLKERLNSLEEVSSS